MIAQVLLEVTIAIYSFKSTDDLYLQASQIKIITLRLTKLFATVIV